MQDWLWLIPMAPLLGALINGLLGPRLPRRLVEAVAVLLPLASLTVSVLAFLAVRKSATLAHSYFSWILAGEISIDFGLHVDALSGIMILVVTGVGSIIHLYSVGYMHQDPGVWRFFSYLNLFLFAMLLLVMGDSLPVLFVGWEGVGLCSYLLIGYWYKDGANAEAGKKAFITNRIGDFGFLVGMFALFSLYGTLGFEGMRTGTPRLEGGPFAGWTVQRVLEFSGLCLFIGAAGKSAQIPLYVWLPDAIAGPTPVSALIHAATMVTAGVYMIARLNFLYVLIPTVLAGIGVVAAATALLSAIIAVAQNDIKKILAYSTISQLGFMFCGMAAMAFTAGMFHLVTHAFFKALLFLGAGAVIHALHEEQDIRKMGGLASKLRGVFILFAIGGLALAGLWPLSGFFSKDAILMGVYERFAQGGAAWIAIWVLLIGTVVLTAFYTTRLILLVFFGHGKHEHPHPPGWTMMSALVLLGLLSAIGGGLQQGLESLLSPIWKQHIVVGEHAHHRAMAFSIGAFLVGFFGACFVYLRARGWLDRFVQGSGRRLHRLVERKFFVDEAYFWLVIAPLQMGAAALWFLLDRIVIDTVLVGGTGKLVYVTSGFIRRAQTGTVNAAAAAIVVGVIGTLGYLLYRLFHG